jgi:protein gp37
MAPRKPNSDGAWWDATWNTMGGCRPISAGCVNCYAARDAGTLQASLDDPLYRDTTEFKGGRYTFNGSLRERPREHPGWTFPLRWKGAARPLLGEGMPSLIFVGDMAEIFLPGRSEAVIDRTLGTLASSNHIGLVLTKLPERMAEYLLAQPTITQQQLRQRLWVGFSAEDQANFDLRWAKMRALSGWTIFVSIAPMIGPVRLPDDFLALGKWVIVSGEQGPYCRPMSAQWARALRDQCASGVAFFMKQLGMKRPIPPDLPIRQFPAIAERERAAD